jgi:hypothetical protein
VIWVLSGTVYALLGMMRESGVEPVRTLTDEAAEAVLGMSEATTNIATSRDRDFWVKVIPSRVSPRGFDASASA